MSDENIPYVDHEITNTKDDLTTWITGIKKLAIPDCQKRVTERFVRDCETLITDVNRDDDISAADLCDFGDRRNSLEIQYHNLLEDLQ